MPTAAQTVQKKWAKGSLASFGRWLGGLKNPKPQATAIVKKVDGLIRASAGAGTGPERTRYAVPVWQLQVDGLARDLLGKKPRVIPKGVTVGKDTVKAPKGLTLKQIVAGAKKRKKPARAAGRPPSIFPKKPPKPWDVKPERKVVMGGLQSNAKITRIPALEKSSGGAAWKKFFKRHAGRNLDDPANMSVMPGLGVGAAFRASETIVGPNGWSFEYFVTDAGGDELALHGHASHNDSYVASWHTVIAPRSPLEKGGRDGDMAVKMITASAIDGARRALTVIARQYGHKLSTSPNKFKPTPRAYHAQIAKMYGADLRGAPLFVKVDWSGKTLVNPNDDFFGSLH